MVSIKVRVGQTSRVFNLSSSVTMPPLGGVLIFVFLPFGLFVHHFIKPKFTPNLVSNLF